MKTLILAGCALRALSALAHADSLPKTMLGNWCAVSESEDLYIRKACPDSDGKLLRFGKTNTYFGKAGVRSKAFNVKLVELTWSRDPVLAKAHVGPLNLSSN
jgi:hypothetical protein